MVYAVKGNKRYQVGDNTSLRTEYLSRGYDIVDENGDVIQHSPAKTVPYAKYAALLEENAALKKELADVNAQIPAEVPVDEVSACEAAENPKGKKR